MRENTINRDELIQVAVIIKSLASAYRKAGKGERAAGIDETANLLDEFARNKRSVEQLLVDTAKNAPKT